MPEGGGGGKGGTLKIFHLGVLFFFISAELALEIRSKRHPASGF